MDLTSIDPSLVSEITKIVKELPYEFIDHDFLPQKKFILDKSTRKAALTPRRGGKSTSASIMLCKTAIEAPGSESQYIALTRDSARYIMWRPILLPMLKSAGVKFKANEVEMSVQLENGSRIYLAGADASERDMEKMRGRKNDLVILDECASFRAHIRRLVEEILEPTLIDKRGTLAMVGTPGEMLAGFFYDVTTGKEPGWSVHRWSTMDNPHMRVQMAEAIAEKEKIDPNFRSKPKYRREYFGEWAADSQSKVYQYTESNLVEVLPPRKWQYGLGVDLGWEDPTAFVLMCHHPDAGMYVISALKHDKLYFDDINAIIMDYNQQHLLTDIVIDNADKQSVEDMRVRFGWNFIPAKKTEKTNQIGLFNSDLANGNLKILEKESRPLLDEWDMLTWDSNTSPRREDPRAPNHCCDAALYIHRHIRHIYRPESKRRLSYKELQEKQMRDWEEEDMFAPPADKAWWDT